MATSVPHPCPSTLALESLITWPPTSLNFTSSGMLCGWPGPRRQREVKDAQPRLDPQSVRHLALEAPVGPPGSLSNTPRIVSGSLFYLKPTQRPELAQQTAPLCSSPPQLPLPRFHHAEREQAAPSERARAHSCPIQWRGHSNGIAACGSATGAPGSPRSATPSCA